MEDVKSTNWSTVCHEENPDLALSTFMSLFSQIADIHAPLKKSTVRAKSAPWISNDLKILMAQRNEAKKIVDTSGSPSGRENYCKLRNQVTKLNRSKKKEYYQSKINDSKNNRKNFGKD